MNLRMMVLRGNLRCALLRKLRSTRRQKKEKLEKYFFHETPLWTRKSHNKSKLTLDCTELEFRFLAPSGSLSLFENPYIQHSLFSGFPAAAAPSVRHAPAGAAQPSARAE